MQNQPGIDKSKIKKFSDLNDEEKRKIAFVSRKQSLYSKCKKIARDKYGYDDHIDCQARISPNCAKTMELNKRFAWHVHAEIHSDKNEVYLSENNLFPVCYSCHLMLYERYDFKDESIYFIRNKGYNMRKNLGMLDK